MKATISSRVVPSVVKLGVVSLAIVLCLVPAQLGAQTWNGGSAGTTWNNASNWSPGTVPNSTSASATFNNGSGTGTQAVPSSISLGIPITVTTLTYNSSVANTFAITDSTNSLTFDPASNYATALVTGNSNTTLNFNVNTTFNNQYGTGIGNSDFVDPAAGSTINFNSGYTVTLANADSIRTDALGTVNLYANFNTGSSTAPLVNEGGTVNWDPASYTSTNSVGGTLRITGVSNNVGIVNIEENLLLADSTGANTGSIQFGGNVNTNSSNYGDLYIVTNGVSVANNITDNGTAQVGGASNNVFVLGTNISGTGTGTFSGKYTITDSNLGRTHQFTAASNNTAIFNGILAGGDSTTVLQKTGAGLVEFAGSSANSYSSAAGMEVMAGTLELVKTSGLALTGNALVDNGATLLLGGSSQTGTATNLTLAGGTFAAGTNTDTLGTLTLTTASTLTINSGAHLVFANSSTTFGSFALTINGVVGSSSLQFGTSSTGLTSAELADITFLNYDGLGDNATGGQISATGFVTAVPEPTSLALLFAGLAGGALALRRSPRLPVPGQA